MMTMPTKSTWIAGVDIAKILAMYLVVLCHVVLVCGNPSITHYAAEASSYDIAVVRSLIKSVSDSCINLFGIVSGFLCVYSQCRYSRVVSLWITTVFWGVAMCAICSLLGYHVSSSYYLKALFPLFCQQYWFFTAYFMLFLLMPLLNQAVLGMERKRLKTALSLIVLFSCACSFRADVFWLFRGYSTAWLAVLYLIGAYIRVYDPFKWRVRRCLMVIVGLMVLSASREIVMLVIGRHVPGDTLHLISYVSPMTLGIALMFFLLLKRIEIRNAVAVKLIKILSAASFGVYLIHVQKFVFKQIWIPRLADIRIETVGELLLYALVIPVGVFPIATLMEYGRSRLFQIGGIGRLLSKMDRA